MVDEDELCRPDEPPSHARSGRAVAAVERDCWGFANWQVTRGSRNVRSSDSHLETRSGSPECRFEFMAHLRETALRQIPVDAVHTLQPSRAARIVTTSLPGEGIPSLRRFT